MTALFLTSTALLAIILWLVNGVQKIGAVSRGTPIGDRSGEALLLIDLQACVWNEGLYPVDAKSKAKTAILAEIRAAKQAGHPVIALRQEWSIPSTRLIARLTMGGKALAGTPGTELAEPFADLADQVLVKRVQDGFETGALDARLQNLKVGHLKLVGLDLNHCVLKTALAARNRGYQVTVIKEGTLAVAQTVRSELQLSAREVAVQ